MKKQTLIALCMLIAACVNANCPPPQTVIIETVEATQKQVAMFLEAGYVHVNVTLLTERPHRFEVEAYGCVNQPCDRCQTQ